MTHDSDTTSPRHTYLCALPTRGGVCDCQPGHNPSIDPWPELSGEQHEDGETDGRPPVSPFRPGGRHRMFTSGLFADPPLDEPAVA